MKTLFNARFDEAIKDVGDPYPDPGGPNFERAEVDANGFLELLDGDDSYIAQEITTDGGKTIMVYYTELNPDNYVVAIDGKPIIGIHKGNGRHVNYIENFTKSNNAILGQLIDILLPARD